MKSLIFGIVIIWGVDQAFGHGRLMDPVGRSSAWRLGFHTPQNYDDNALFCGGFATKQSNGGKCGVCGDPFNGRRENEPPSGRYATGTIVKRYKVGQVISTKSDITANHFGYMEYRICPHNDVHTPVTQQCLDKYVLQRADGLGSRVNITGRRTGNYKMDYKLPDGITCSQCVVQWKYHAANSWGVDPVSGRGCIGCGPQEEFYGCADVAIDPRDTIGPIPPIVIVTQPPTTRAPPATTQRPPVVTNGHIPTGQCYAINLWKGDPNLDRWCQNSCAVGKCPPLACACGSQPATQKVTTKAPTTTTTTSTTPSTTTTTTTTTTPKPTTTSTTTTSTTSTTTTPAPPAQTQYVNRYVCKAINLWAGNEYLDRWCSDACAHGNCPADSCKCSMVQIVVTKPTTEAPLFPITDAQTTHAPSAPPSVVHTAKVCTAVGIWKDIAVFDRWCTDECNRDNCAQETCKCNDTPLFPLTKTTTTTTTTAPSTAPSSAAKASTSFHTCTTNGIVEGDYWKQWCQRNCDRNYCAVDYCFCS